MTIKVLKTYFKYLFVMCTSTCICGENLTILLFCRDRVLNLIRANNCPRGPGPTMKTGNQYKKKIVAEVCTFNVIGDD